MQLASFYVALYKPPEYQRVYLLQKRTPMSLHGTTTASLDLSGNDPQIFFTNSIGLPTLKYSNKDQA